MAGSGSGGSGPGSAGVQYTTGAKIQTQMPKRGWTHADVQNVLNAPHRTVPTQDTRYLPGGGQQNNPATAYVRSDGHYVIRNDLTGDIVQLSNRNDAAWKAPF